MELDVSPLAGWKYSDREALCSRDSSVFQTDASGSTLTPSFRGLCWNALTKCLLVCDVVECCVRVFRVTSAASDERTTPLLEFTLNPDMARIGSKGTGSGQFVLPVAVDVNSRGEIAVADATLSRVQVFMGSGTLQCAFGRVGSNRSEFRYIADLKFTLVGHLAVVDAGNHRIQLMTPTGGLVLTIGTFGSRFGEFSVPCAIAVSRTTGDLFVCDQGNKRVQRLSAKGKRLANWGSTRQQRRPSGLTASALTAATNASGSAPTWKDVNVDESSGRLLSVFEMPSDIAIGANGAVAVCDSGASGRILFFSDTGVCRSVVATPAQWQPIAICFCDGILIAVSRSSRMDDDRTAQADPNQHTSSTESVSACAFSLTLYPAPQRVSVGKLALWPVRSVVLMLRFLTYADAINVRCVSRFLHRVCRLLRNAWQLAPLVPGCGTVRKYNRVVTRATGLVAVQEAFDMWGLRVRTPSQGLRRHVMDFDAGFCNAISSLYSAMFRFLHEDILRALFQYHARSNRSSTTCGDEIDHAAFVEIVTVVEEVRGGFLHWEQCEAFRSIPTADVPRVRSAPPLSPVAADRLTQVPPALRLVESAQQQQLNRLLMKLAQL